MSSDSEVISVQRQEDGWVWSILSDDPVSHRVVVIRQSRLVYISYEAAYQDAQVSFDQMRDGSDAPD